MIVDSFFFFISLSVLQEAHHWKVFGWFLNLHFWFISLCFRIEIPFFVLFFTVCCWKFNWWPLMVDATKSVESLWFSFFIGLICITYIFFFWLILEKYIVDNNSWIRCLSHAALKSYPFLFFLGFLNCLQSAWGNVWTVFSVIMAS